MNQLDEDDFLRDLNDESSDGALADKSRRKKKKPSERSDHKKSPQVEKALKKKVKTSVGPKGGALSIPDKLELVAPLTLMSEFEFSKVGERIGVLDEVKKIHAKGRGYKQMYILKCPSGAKVVFAIVPSDNRRMKFGMKLTLNPALLNEEDVALLRKVLKVGFLPDWKFIVSNLLIRRVDQAYDDAYLDNVIIIQAVGSPVEEKYVVRTDRRGRVQSWYCGSLESRVRHVMYDQQASDEAKLRYGEKSLKLLAQKRPKAEDDAELVIGIVRKRIETRREFATPLTLRDVDTQSEPLGRFRVFVLTDAAITDGPEGFSMYLDSVRLHGVAGARSESLRYNASRKNKAGIRAFETYLSEHVIPWWDRAGLDASVEQALRKTACWKVLKYLADKTRTYKNNNLRNRSD